MMIMEIMQKVAKGIAFKDPINKNEAQRIMDAFVDDSTMFHNNFKSNEEVQELIMQMKEAAQWWEQLFSTPEGKLELEKCFYYLVH